MKLDKGKHERGQNIMRARGRGSCGELRQLHQNVQICHWTHRKNKLWIEEEFRINFFSNRRAINKGSDLIESWWFWRDRLIGKVSHFWARQLLSTLWAPVKVKANNCHAGPMLHPAGGSRVLIRTETTQGRVFPSHWSITELHSWMARQSHPELRLENKEGETHSRTQNTKPHKND